MLHTLLSRVGLANYLTAPGHGPKARRQRDHAHDHSHEHGHGRRHTHDEAHIVGGVALQPCVPGRDCEDCPNRELDAAHLPLCLLEPGMRAQVVKIGEGRRCRKRLADMGLAPGMEVRVLRASRGRGPMILGLCSDARVALGWGMANQIDVKVLP